MANLTQNFFSIMLSEGFLNFNGKIFRNDKLLISPNNHSFRYGDGCFETMKLMNGKIILEAYHLERLFTSLQTMQFNKPNYFISIDFKEQINEIIKRNRLKKIARIRVTIARGDGGLYDVENHNPNYLIQAWDLNSANNRLNENGWVMDIYKDARKVCDKYSHIKSNNFLCYVMAALWAKENKLNDVLLLNPYDRIADTTIANMFIVKDGIIKTPALTEGCVAGVMRKYLLKCMKEEGIPVEETQITADEVLEASEVFLTNAIYGIRWVKQIGKSNYKIQLAKVLYEKFIAPLYFEPEVIKDPEKAFYLLQSKSPKNTL